MRDSMAGLVARLRRMVGDRAGAGQVFSDEELQATLDAYQTPQRYRELAALETIAPGGATDYLDWYADVAPWEADVTVVDSDYAALTPASSDPLTGRWTFATSQSAVLATGKTYDLYAAATDILTEWIASLKLEFDFTADGATYNRSQKIAHLESLLAKYSGAGGPSVVTMWRSDVN